MGAGPTARNISDATGAGMQKLREGMLAGKSQHCKMCGKKICICGYMKKQQGGGGDDMDEKRRRIG